MIHGSMDRRQIVGHMDCRSHGLEVAWKHGSETDWRTYGYEVAWKHGSETDWRTHGLEVA